ncbi:nucleotide sugar dehydrogenase [Halopenitus sp. POP-27]|uniref:nucleotide sugar dehydrogenase n=1 Tax=Halopenitus sp. POP-27 TaxID=2994425 RepID=UPI002468438A|nr:nucleotide sugar dehydrogenase [Halopenitus sp. POP-27]
MKPYNNHEEDLREAFIGGDVPVAVYGLGKMGLPLAAVYADVCGSVTGVDIDETIVESVSAGTAHVDGEPGLDQLVQRTVEAGELSATTDGQHAAATASIHVIIVPTLVTDDNEPDLSVVASVVSDIAAGLDPGDVVVIESTVPPQTCREVVEPLLAEESGLDVDEFGVAFCPERTSSGRAIEDIRGAYQKVVGGSDPEATRVARIVYEAINDAGVVSVSDATTAEAVKVFEGVYRDVNIALANELAKLADDLEIDVLEAIEVANTLPMCDIHTPGAGVGGHCIPYYPYFLINQFDGPTPLIETARNVNDSMPEFVTEKLIDGLTERNTALSDATVVVLGLTYRAGVAELRHAPSIPIVERLVTQNAEVFVVDPVLEDFSAFNGATPVEQSEIYGADPDAVVLVTGHDEFESIDWDGFDRSLVVVDGRQALDLAETDHWVYTIGRGRNVQ